MRKIELVNTDNHTVAYRAAYESTISNDVVSDLIGTLQSQAGINGNQASSLIHKALRVLDIEETSHARINDEWTLSVEVLEKPSVEIPVEVIDNFYTEFEKLEKLLLEMMNGRIIAKGEVAELHAAKYYLETLYKMRNTIRDGIK